MFVYFTSIKYIAREVIGYIGGQGAPSMGQVSAVLDCKDTYRPPPCPPSDPPVTPHALFLTFQNQRGSAPRQLLKQVSMPVDLDNHASAGVPGSVRSGGKTTGTLLRTVSTDDNGVHSRGEPPRMTRWAGGKSKRFVRDGAGSSNRSLRVPTEEAVTKWLIAVLGAGAAGGDDDGGGQVTLAGRLRDGVVLVRFVRAVGGARTSRIPKVREYFANKRPSVRVIC